MSKTKKRILKVPTNVNLRRPEALKRIHSLVQAGQFRNFSECGETLILEAYERRKYEATQPAFPGSPIIAQAH